MKRREFIATTALTAIAISASGFIRFNGINFEGDCETTTDILGPYYRPDSPVRNNLRIKGEAGEQIELRGIIKYKDCITPYKNAKIELWHCDNNGVYDNTSDKFLYRGTTYCNEKGEYSFKTILPVAYEVRSGVFRPAHFHLMITAVGYQSLVTQLYFTGDKYIAEDDSASAPTASKRILEIQTSKDNTKIVNYDVSMSENLIVEAAVLDKLAGFYIHESDKETKTEFFSKNKMLWVKKFWMKDEPYGMKLEYVGDNTFTIPGVQGGVSFDFNFELMQSGSVKLTIIHTNSEGEKDVTVATKEI